MIVSWCSAYMHRFVMPISFKNVVACRIRARIFRRPSTLWFHPVISTNAHHTKKNRMRSNARAVGSIYLKRCISLSRYARAYITHWRQRLRSLAKDFLHTAGCVSRRHPISLLPRPLTWTSRNDGVGTSLKSALGTLPAYSRYTDIQERKRSKAISFITQSQRYLVFFVNILETPLRWRKAEVREIVLDFNLQLRNIASDLIRVPISDNVVSMCLPIIYHALSL